MNRLGEIADELTELIEELEQSNLAGETGALRAALQRAFAKACEAERVQRRKEPAVPRIDKRPASPRARALAPEPVGSGVVIELRRSWRFGAARARRLND